ncbi:MAG: deoxyribodipyrimidine photo-lyase [Ginsengibacter sp.]
MKAVNIFWFRRDLRLFDNAGLYHALKQNIPIVPIFIFDKNILDKLEDKSDRRLTFIHSVITELQNELTKAGSSLEVYYGFPEKVFDQLMWKYDIKEVFASADYEPYAIERDNAVKNILYKKDISFHTYKDHVIFEKDEVLKEDQTPYSVFTPYSKRWKSKLNDFYLQSYPSNKLISNFFKQPPTPFLSLNSMNFIETDKKFAAREFSEELISKYFLQRNFPGVNGTSKLGVHLRFGTISIRELARNGARLNETFLNELIWRDFYQAILWHFPKVGKHKAFKEEYENIQWRNNEEEFARWCMGQTGYPIVDAGMRELNQTGFMHNRVRMIVASFLCKDLLVDWRWGEAYFAQKLLDFDLASNNGGWQWASGSGCDSAPYFRIFNPYLQTKKFDKDLTYIKKWVPEFQEFSYPVPIVEHEFARKRCLEVYGKAIKNLN